MIDIYKVSRITLPPQYYGPGVYQRLEQAVIEKLQTAGSLEEALKAGWIQEVAPTKGNPPLRRFVMYVTDGNHYQTISLSFSLVRNGDFLRA